MLWDILIKVSVNENQKSAAHTSNNTLATSANRKGS